MKLIVVLLALAALKFLNIFNTPARYAWFQRYAQKIQHWFSGLDFAWLTITAIIIPPLVVLAIIEIAFDNWLWGFIAIVIDVLVLWYCLWPVTLEKMVENLLKKDLAEESQTKVVAEVPASQEVQQLTANTNRQVSEQLLCRANEKTFAVIFWYLVLGAFGALLYRCISLLQNNTQLQDSSLQSLNKPVTFLQQLLDWIPARLTALTYVLAGDFITGFSQWSKLVWSNWQANNTVLIKTGLAASGFNAEDTMQADAEESRGLLRMVDRTLVVWVIAIAIFTLGALVY